MIDLLHLHLRITDQLLSLLVSALNENDRGTGSDLNQRPNFKKYLEFLQNDCKITKPYYVKQNGNESTIKFRNMNGNERNKILEQIHEKNMINMFSDLKDRLLNLNFVFHEYYSLFCLIKSFATMPIDLGALEMRLREWLVRYMVEQPKCTPYIHSFVFHMTEFLLLNPDLKSFNIQGLEKLNDLTSKYYFSQTNRKPLTYIRQLVEKRNRNEFLETKGEQDDLF